MGRDCVYLSYVRVGVNGNVILNNQSLALAVLN